MNTTCPSPQAPLYPGDELIAPGFRAVAVPSYLAAVRAVLFGTDPDRYMLNYRCRQLLAATHASPLEGHLLAPDPRVTYGFSDAPFLAESAFAPRVVRLEGSESDRLTVGGVPAAPDHSGRMMRSSRVTVSSDATLVVAGMQPGYTTHVVEFSPGDKVVLPGTGYFFRVNAAGPGASWIVECLNRPQLGLGDLVSAVGSVGETNLVRLFGPDGVGEPYATFKACWGAAELPMRVGGLVAALVYRTEEARAGGG